jgi:hypothetical protein
MKALLCAAAFALAAVGTSAEETRLGAGVSLKDATPIKAGIERHDAAASKKYQIKATGAVIK